MASIRAAVRANDVTHWAQVFLSRLDPALAVRAVAFAQPIGRLWLNALQMTVVPLVLALVVVGVSAANDAAASGRIARRAIVVFALLLSAGAVFAAIVDPLLLALLPRDPAAIEKLRAAIPAVAPCGRRMRSGTRRRSHRAEPSDRSDGRCR